MTLSQALFTHVAGLANVVAVASDRVYAVDAPRPSSVSAPYEDVVVISFEGAEHDSLNNEPCNRIANYVITVVSKSHLRAVELAESIVRSLYGYRGTMGGVGGVAVVDIEATETPEDFDPEHSLFARNISLRITYEF